MLTTKLSLTDIGLACGFCDQSYFARAFSRNVGASPKRLAALEIRSVEKIRSGLPTALSYKSARKLSNRPDTAV